MSCPFENEVLLIDSEAPLERRAFLETHVRDCESCGGALDKLRAMRSWARGISAPSERPDARAELWAKIDRPRAPHGMKLEPALLVLVLVLVLVLGRMGYRAGQTRMPEAGATIDAASLQAKTSHPSIVRERERELQLDQRALELDPILTPPLGRESSGTTMTTEVDRASSQLPLLAGRIEATMAKAKSELDRDPPEAARIARGLVDQKETPPQIEVEAIALIADAHRRSGKLGESAEWYDRLAKHPNGAPYVEEAAYQRARLLLRLGRPKDALAALAQPMPSTALLPERLALEAELQPSREQANALYKRAAAAAREAGDPRSAEELEAKIK